MKFEEQYTEDRKLIIGKNDLETWCKNHDTKIIEDEWIKEKNGPMSDYKAGSAKRVYWKCSICGEEYIKSIRERVSGRRHEPCGRKLGIENLKKYHRDLIDEKNTLAVMYPELLEEWDYEKNEELGLDPKYLSAFSSKRAHWKCKKCGNKWDAIITMRTLYGYGCKICRKNKKHNIK